MKTSGIEILAYDDTPLGVLCLRRREMLSLPGVVVTEVTLNHEFLMSSRHTDSEVALAARALELHSGNSLSVMVGGLGLGYTARAALDSDRVAAVDVVEFLPQVIGWTRDELIPLGAELNADPRLSILEADVYALLRDTPAKTYDLILIDVDHSPDDRLADENGGFYSVEGLERAVEHLAPGGILGVWSYAESSPFANALRETFSDVRVECVTHFNENIGEECTDWLFFARTPTRSKTSIR